MKKALETPAVWETHRKADSLLARDLRNTRRVRNL